MCSSSPAATGIAAARRPPACRPRPTPGWRVPGRPRVPQHDSRRHQVEAAGPVALLLEAPIPDFPKAVEEHRPGQRVARLTFVQAGMHAAAQFNTLQPVQDEQRALDPAQLAQGHGQSVLARVAAELAQHQRGGDGALLDPSGQAQDVVPVGTHVLDVQGAADQRAQRRVR